MIKVQIAKAGGMSAGYWERLGCTELLVLYRLRRTAPPIEVILALQWIDGHAVQYRFAIEYADKVFAAALRMGASFEDARDALLEEAK